MGYLTATQTKVLAGEREREHEGGRDWGLDGEYSRTRIRRGDIDHKVVYENPPEMFGFF